MISKSVENTVEKGEIACYKQFLLFLQCFKNPVQQTLENTGLFGKGLNLLFTEHGSDTFPFCLILPDLSLTYISLYIYHILYYVAML